MNDMRLTRRTALPALLALTGAPFAGGESRAQDDNLLPLRDDSGKPVPNYKLPPELSVTTLPGIVWTGAAHGDVILVEFFDYNCPFCRKAVGELHQMLEGDKALRLGLVNNAILGLGSVLAAKVQQAVLRLYGPARAYEFHRKALGRHVALDGLGALDLAKGMALDAGKIEASADSDEVASVLKRQIGLANSLGFEATPSFILKNVGMLGYPGPQSLKRMIAAVRTCDNLAC